jgi:hypothetical protein
LCCQSMNLCSSYQVMMGFLDLGCWQRGMRWTSCLAVVFVSPALQWLFSRAAVNMLTRASACPSRPWTEKSPAMLPQSRLQQRHSAAAQWPVIQRSAASSTLARSLCRSLLFLRLQVGLRMHTAEDRFMKRLVLSSLLPVGIPHLPPTQMDPTCIHLHPNGITWTQFAGACKAYCRRTLQDGC